MMRYSDIPKDKRRQLTVQVIRESNTLQGLQVATLLGSIFLGHQLGARIATTILEPNSFWGEVLLSVCAGGAIALAALNFIVMPIVKRRVLEKFQPIQSPQRNAGSRPSSGGPSASETPSSIGPRG